MKWCEFPLSHDNHVTKFRLMTCLLNSDLRQNWLLVVHVSDWHSHLGCLTPHFYSILFNYNSLPVIGGALITWSHSGERSGTWQADCNDFVAIAGDLIRMIPVCCCRMIEKIWQILLPWAARDKLEDWAGFNVRLFMSHDTAGASYWMRADCSDNVVKYS